MRSAQHLHFLSYSVAREPNHVDWKSRNSFTVARHATASRRCIGVFNKTRRRLTSSIIPNTVERIVTKCTEFITVYHCDEKIVWIE